MTELLLALVKAAGLAAAAGVDAYNKERADRAVARAELEAKARAALAN